MYYVSSCSSKNLSLFDVLFFLLYRCLRRCSDRHFLFKERYLAEPEITYRRERFVLSASLEFYQKKITIKKKKCYIHERERLKTHRKGNDKSVVSKPPVFNQSKTRSYCYEYRQLNSGKEISDKAQKTNALSSAVMKYTDGSKTKKCENFCDTS